MAAWLNLVLLLGSLAWIRAGVGVFALLAGGHYLREFVRNPDAACAVTSPGERRRFKDRLKEAVAEQSFLLAVAGIMALAVAVNLIELLCSAGIPAVYTQVLALSDLSPTAHYAYLMLCISVFLLDDAIVFVSAMLSLQATGLAATYSRYSHLIGGAVLLAVGSSYGLNGSHLHEPGVASRPAVCRNDARARGAGTPVCRCVLAYSLGPGRATIGNTDSCSPRHHGCSSPVGGDRLAHRYLDSSLARSAASLHSGRSRASSFLARANALLAPVLMPV